jgi:AhpD family alkylhydroperoxidase
MRLHENRTRRWCLQSSPHQLHFVSFENAVPDAARVAFYHRDFFAAPMGAWTQAAMRGPSKWSVSERELIAAMVAKWNSCAFCVGAHGAIAAKEIQRSAVDAALTDFRVAPSPKV